MFGPNKNQKAHRPQGWLILLPGVLLSGWGTWSLWSTTRAADAETRRQMHGAVELVREKLAVMLDGPAPGWTQESTTIRIQKGTLASPLLYTEIPEPQAENEAQRLFAAGKFAEVFGEHRSAISASGLPLSVLSAEGMMRTATTPEQTLHWARLTREHALNAAPSPVSAVVLGNVLRHLEEQRVGCPFDLRYSLNDWRMRERLRRLLLSRSADLVLLDRMAVLDAHDPHLSKPVQWLFWKEPNGLRVWPVMALHDSLTDLIHGHLRREIPNWMGFRVFTDDGFSILPRSEKKAGMTPGAVAATAGGLHLEAYVSSPDSLRREQQRGLWIQGSLLAAALGGTVLAWIHSRRAWRRQADLAAQKDNFLASVSHELRTPLASVRTLTENLAAGTVSGDSARQHYYAVMLGEMQRLSGLVENVLDFARISQDRKHYDFAPCDPTELVHDALRPMLPLAEKRGIAIKETIEPLSQTPIADAAALQQALINLVDNALKFAPAGTTICVHARPARDGWELCVEDAGPGIPAGEEQRIFERFYRAGSELRRETPGAGIGLSLVQHTALAHGGQAFAMNLPEGGACVGLRLPFSPPAGPTP